MNIVPDCFFLANTSSDVSYPQGDHILFFDNISADRGFDLTNSDTITTFTAPIDGYYFFNCHPIIRIASGGRGVFFASLSLIINGDRSNPVIFHPEIKNNLILDVENFKCRLSAKDTVVVNFNYSTNGDFVLKTESGASWCGCLENQISN